MTTASQCSQVSCQLLAAFFLIGQTWSDPVLLVVSPAASEKERPDRVRLGLTSQKELNHYSHVGDI